MTKASKTTPVANTCENLTPKGYSLLKEARVFRHTFSRPLSVKTGFTRLCGIIVAVRRIYRTRVIRVGKPPLPRQPLHGAKRFPSDMISADYK